MPRSISSEQAAPSSPSSSRKRLFARANHFSSNGKPGPLVDNNPPPVVRPPYREAKKSLSAIKTKLQVIGTPLKLFVISQPQCAPQGLFDRWRHATAVQVQSKGRACSKPFDANGTSPQIFYQSQWARISESPPSHAPRWNRFSMSLLKAVRGNSLSPFPRVHVEYPEGVSAVFPYRLGS